MGGFQHQAYDQRRHRRALRQQPATLASARRVGTFPGAHNIDRMLTSGCVRQLCAVARSSFKFPLRLPNSIAEAALMDEGGGINQSSATKSDGTSHPEEVS